MRFRDTRAEDSGRSPRLARASPRGRPRARPRRRSGRPAGQLSPPQTSSTGHEISSSRKGWLGPGSSRRPEASTREAVAREGEVGRRRWLNARASTRSGWRKASRLLGDHQSARRGREPERGRGGTRSINPTQRAMSRTRRAASGRPRQGRAPDPPTAGSATQPPSELPHTTARPSGARYQAHRGRGTELSPRIGSSSRKRRARSRTPAWSRASARRLLTRRTNRRAERHVSCCRRTVSRSSGGPSPLELEGAGVPNHKLDRVLDQRLSHAGIFSAPDRIAALVDGPAEGRRSAAAAEL